MAEKEDAYFKGGDSEPKGFLAFLWNPYTKEFCGRTGGSWLKITIFYIIFYACLAAFWTIMLLVFYRTLDFYEPTYKLGASRIGTNPGLGFRPRPQGDYVDSTLIWFKHSETGGWKKWVDALDNDLKEYQGKQFGEFLETCDFSREKNEKKVCQFTLEKIDNNCTQARNYGYDVGHPCLLIKLNRIYGWKPEPYKNNASFPDNMPTSIKANYDPRLTFISCEGENPADKENIGPVSYYPSQGIPNYYFPFTNVPGYLSPFVFVHFQRPNTGVLINIECKAWAANIFHDRKDRLGSVHFELLID